MIIAARNGDCRVRVKRCMQEPTQETGKQTEGCVYLRILLEWLRPLKSIINIGYLVMNNSVLAFFKCSVLVLN